MNKFTQSEAILLLSSNFQPKVFFTESSPKLAVDSPVEREGSREGGGGVVTNSEYFPQ